MRVTGGGGGLKFGGLHADTSVVSCQTCGGTGHDETDCSERPTAIMDFLREPDHGEPGSDSFSGSQWVPTGDVVLGADALSAQAIAASSPLPCEQPGWLPDNEIRVAADDWSVPEVEPARFAEVSGPLTSGPASVPTMGAPPPASGAPTPPAWWAKPITLRWSRR